MVGAVTWWQAAVLGLVEGITEYLPVSSTGHLILASSLMGLDEPPEVKAAVDAFNVVIQGGAILAVLGLYWTRVVRMVRGVLGKDAAGRRLFVNLVVAFLPAAVLGVLFDDWIEARLFNAPAVLAALFVGGVWMIWLDRWKLRGQRERERQPLPDGRGSLEAGRTGRRPVPPEAGRATGGTPVPPEGGGEGRAARLPDGRGSLEAGRTGRRPVPPEAGRATGGTPVPPECEGVTLETMTWRQALVVGGLQCVAMWPGTSRSMMTIGGGVLVGLKPKEAAEFSFLLGLPTLGGACVLKLAKNLKESHETGGPNLFEVIGVVPSVVGLVVAAVSAVVAVRWLVGFLNRHGLEAFGWYRIGLCVVLGAAVAMGWVRV